MIFQTPEGVIIEATTLFFAYVIKYYRLIPRYEPSISPSDFKAVIPAEGQPEDKESIEIDYLLI